MPVKVVFKPVLTTPDAIPSYAWKANSTADCIG